MNWFDNLISYHRVLLREYRHTVDLMEAGALKTYEKRDGKEIDTTQQMIGLLQRLIAEVESANAKIERRV